MNIILGTNIWTSYFMADRHLELLDIKYRNNLTVYTNNPLIVELEDVLNRPKIKKYIEVPIDDLMEFHLRFCIFHKTKLLYRNSPDPKDNFLFDLAMQTRSKYVVTGDKKLLAINMTGYQFISKSKFESIFEY